VDPVLPAAGALDPDCDTASADAAESLNPAADPGYLFRSNRDMILLAALTARAFLLLIFRAQLRM
jgi:hypothetical protein